MRRLHDLFTRRRKMILLSWAVGAYALCLAAVLLGEERSPTRQGTMALDYDLDATSYIYCVTLGNSTSYAQGAIRVSTLVKTAGASTTVSAVISGSLPFTPVVAGDLFLLSVDGADNTERVVTAKASGDSITVNANLDIPAAGSAFYYRTLTCASGAEDGWITTRGASEVNFAWIARQLNTTSGIDLRVEGRNVGGVAAAANLLSTTFTAVGGGGLSVQAPWDQMRLGMKMNTTDDGSDVGAAAEQLSITFRVVGARS